MPVDRKSFATSRRVSCVEHGGSRSFECHQLKAKRNESGGGVGNRLRRLSTFFPVWNGYGMP